LDPFLRGLKSLFPQTPVIVGGYQAILAPEETIGHPAVDYACVGDGELPLAALVRRLQDQRDGPLAGLWEKKADGSVERHEPVLTSNLAALPFPDYGLFEREGQLRGLNLSNFGSTDFFVLPVMSGRGCLYQCSYCCNGSMLRRYRGKGKYLRKYAPDALVAELARLRERYGVQCFEFWDELFMFDMEFVWQFLALYQRDIGLPFSIMARVEKMDEKFCRLAADAGCRTIWFGIESGSQTYRQRYLNRNMTNDQILTAAENARKYGINRVSLNMVGMPFETRAHMLETLALNQTIAPEFFVFFIYLPLRDTPLYELAKENGLLVPNPAGDVLEGVRNETYRLNLHEHEGGITNRDFNEMCRRMKQFADDNNRL
jgi:radical SAM superfamily enzyme YgiQ (UPF0313 family)